MKDNRPVEKIFKKLTLLKQILLRHDTYIGSIELQKDKLWVYNTAENKLEFREISYVPVLYKIFDEILVNAVDNYRSKQIFIEKTNFYKNFRRQLNDLS